MKLPGADRAVVDPAKVRDYLLSPEHPVGRSKARFFEALGFTPSRWPALRRALIEIAHSADAILGDEAPYGRKYEIHATMVGPTGRSAKVVTVWIVLSDEDFPRLVTAYPGGSR